MIKKITPVNNNEVCIELDELENKELINLIMSETSTAEKKHQRKRKKR